LNILCRRGVRTVLPAGFGSGWDNFRGLFHFSGTPSIDIAGQKDGRYARRQAFLAALVRHPCMPCQLPSVVHPNMQQNLGHGTRPSSGMERCSASVVAFSPDGLLLAASVEVAPQRWCLKVRHQQLHVFKRIKKCRYW
jgi:hypothetical protein